MESREADIHYTVFFFYKKIHLKATRAVMCVLLNSECISRFFLVMKKKKKNNLANTKAWLVTSTIQIELLYILLHFNWMLFRPTNWNDDTNRMTISLMRHIQFNFWSANLNHENKTKNENVFRNLWTNSIHNPKKVHSHTFEFCIWMAHLR